MKPITSLIPPNLQNTKKQGQVSAAKTPKDLKIQTVPTKNSLFGWVNHKITGKELNRVINQIEQILIDMRSADYSASKEIEEIHRELEVLDQSYISKILAVDKSAEEAGSKAIKNQADINRLIAIQKETIAVLQKLKEEREKGAIPEGIEEIYQIQQTQMSLLQKKLKVAYAVAGAAAIFSIIQFLLILLVIL